jgi:hypothetical protein
MRSTEHDEEHWSGNQRGLVPEARGVWRGILTGVAMWAALAAIVWLSHRLA